MDSKICMNELCRTTTSSEWKTGWRLKSGGLAILCQRCGSAYEKLAFCETFHLEDTGWRECRICEKPIHCGCVVSKNFHEYLDFGGIGCRSCAKHLESHSMLPLKIPGQEISNGTMAEDVRPATTNGIDSRKIEKGMNMQMSNAVDVHGPRKLFTTQKDETSASIGQMKGDETMVPYREVNACFPNFKQPSVGSTLFVSPEQGRPKQGVKDMFESLSQPSLTFSLSTTPLTTSSPILPFSGGAVEGSDQSKASSSQQGQKARQVLPKPPKSGPSTSSDVNNGMAPQTRIARPPAEGRGRHQLLPRYWPRITDQELQQISGDLKSTIAPLFEKILSASDAGRIGRLVLPKACAEAYFPAINQSEGVPIKIQDVKGKEWTFQFRFWPNNNSRMYVLEGVTPCIQNMQLQAGDTVTFSRIEPSGQLVMGFRKATNNGDMQDPQTSALPNGGGSSGETSFSGASDNMVANGGRTSEDSLPRHMSMPEKKKARNIGSKSKRLLMHSDDAMELRITWEEAQELLRPPPAAKPTVVMIDDFEFEEYEEPPIFGKRTVFTAHASGEQEQWAQCDNCSKWRRLPVHVLLPAKWACTDNIWDLNRCSCSAPDDMNPRELEVFNRASKDFKRRRIADSNKAGVECEPPSGLDALATAAVLGDNLGNLPEPSVGATTRHPRHRPGCSCIVCIQPPSGKGKHPPNCKCNVCMTVKRRFKTLMLRKKKRQSEREAEMAQSKDQQHMQKHMPEIESTVGQSAVQIRHSNDDGRGMNVNVNVNVNVNMNMNGRQTELGESSKGQLDLNSHPSREDDMIAEAAAGMNMTTLMNAASLPLDMYLKQNGLTNLNNCSLPRPNESNRPPSPPTPTPTPTPPPEETEETDDEETEETEKKEEDE